MNDDPATTDLFEAQRSRLLGIAYRMVGNVTDAEDIVSEAWVRWCAADQAAIDTPAAWLTTVTTRIALDWLRSARHDREQYVGPWLPEPLVVESDPSEGMELAESLTLGFLTMLDRLDPVQRAVFLMADVFGVPYGDIANVVDRSPEACRQIASRARRRIRQPSHRPSPDDRSVVNGLLVALWLGDMDAVLSRLAPEVVCVSDGGATRTAARRPVVGAHRVSRFLVNLVKRFDEGVAISEAVVNGERGLIGRVNGEIDFVAAFEVTDGVVSNVRLVNNPDKLRQVDSRPHLV